MIENIIGLDKSITLALNSSGSLYADGMMLLITYTLTWVPVGLVMLYVVSKNCDMTHFVLVVVALTLCVLISNGLSELCKALVGRLRPCVDPSMAPYLHLAGGYSVGGFGFFSAHAANTMSVAVFLALLFRRKWLSVLIILWSLLNGWSRVYLGVHFLGDVVVGFVVGLAGGLLLYAVYARLTARLVRGRTGAISRGSESEGLASADAVLLETALVLTFATIAILATFWLA